MRVKIFTAVIFFAASVSAASGQTDADMSVFGIKLGEKFAMPECEYKRNYLQPLYTKCFGYTDDTNGRRMTNEIVSIAYPEKSKPEMLVGFIIYGLVIDDKIEALGFTIDSIDYDAMQGKIKDKYGKPNNTLVTTGNNTLYTITTTALNYDNLIITLIKQPAYTKIRIATVNGEDQNAKNAPKKSRERKVIEREKL